MLIIIHCYQRMSSISNYIQIQLGENALVTHLIKAAVFFDWPRECFLVPLCVCGIIVFPLSQIIKSLLLQGKPIQQFFKQCTLEKYFFSKLLSQCKLNGNTHFSKFFHLLWLMYARKTTVISCIGDNH